MSDKQPDPFEEKRKGIEASLLKSDFNAPDKNDQIEMGQAVEHPDGTITHDEKSFADKVRQDMKRENEAGPKLWTEIATDIRDVRESDQGHSR